MSATNRLIDATLKHMERNRSRRSSMNVKAWEVELESLAIAADKERKASGALVLLELDLYKQMPPQKARDYMLEHVLMQLTPEQRAIFDGE